MRLKLVFDAGAGVLLWAQDATALARFGYAVASSDLDVPDDIRAEIDQLVADYDDTFPWHDPASGTLVAAGRPTPGYDEIPPFATRVRALLPRLRAALGPDYTVESDYDG